MNMDTEQDVWRPGLVRRFTEELEADSTLAIQTKAYQEVLDLDTCVQEKRRMDLVYENKHCIESSFTDVELSRQKLISKCDEFFRSVREKEDRKSPRFKLFKQNSSSEQKLAQLIENGGELTVDRVTDLTTQLNSDWEKSNGKVATNFMKICQKLEGHKQIFQCFPSGNIYTSALCGAVTMIVQASVNHKDIAESLSTYVAELSETIVVCKEWLDIFQKSAMQARLSKIYEQYFDFFITVATWYLRPRLGKWLDAFNSEFRVKYESAAKEIKRQIQLVTDQGQIESAREIKNIGDWIPGLEERIVSEIRRQIYPAGVNMRHVLLEMARNGEFINAIQPRQRQASVFLGTTEASNLLSDKSNAENVIDYSTSMNRAEAEQLCERLQSYIDQVGGSDGIRLATQYGRIVAGRDIILKLSRWSAATSSDDLILWIESPYELGPQTSAHLISLGVILTAIRAQAPFISYICQRPRLGTATGLTRDGGEAGVLAMVYSFIRQLLQFQPPDDDLHLQPDILDQLLQPADRWTPALDLLRYLLENTPNLRYCIISGINLIESDCLDRCKEVLALLFAQARKAEPLFRVLLTTSGKSKVLSDTVSPESKVKSDQKFRQMKGKILHRDLPMRE
ncbi:hypothetical protein N7494_002706 [Penicillium frequentans]|uniref:DUF7708 domain-containing protein n=1 Tax=Penicillium frequentans TaxID=3151616 RepID=A0AAD6D657_9EURO|nr:hypothetical protein N7494_002706 [Penicillium glabrum]